MQLFKKIWKFFRFYTLALILSIPAFILMTPFLEKATGLNEELKAIAGEQNIIRIIILYGVITLCIGILFLKNKNDTLKYLYIAFLTYWIIGSGFAYFMLVNIQKSVTSAVQIDIPVPTSTPSTVPTLTITPQPTQVDNSNISASGSEEWGKAVIVDGHTAYKLAPDDRMSTADELFDAMNAYRKTHGVGQLIKDPFLCELAQKRANKQLEQGFGHEGFGELVDSQNEYREISENLSEGKKYGVHIVEWIWGQSLTGHNENQLNNKWTNGCGAIAGYYSTFLFGSR